METKIGVCSILLHTHTHTSSTLNNTKNKISLKNGRNVNNIYMLS